MPNIIETRNLSKQYQMGEVTVNALQGVNFTTQQGEFVAIMGPSGSGKSTLMHLLGGLDDPTSGEIILDGQNITSMSDDDITITRRREIGFIFQFFNLMPTLSAAENVALPLLMDGQNVNSYQSHIDELLSLVDLADRKDHRPHQLSGGQQQRIAIARALATNPKLVLADEPTGNLDSASGGSILKLLRQTCDKKGQTIVMVTHDKRAAAIADRVVFLKDGQLVRNLTMETTPPDKTRTQEIAMISTELDI